MLRSSTLSALVVSGALLSGCAQNVGTNPVAQGTMPQRQAAKSPKSPTRSTLYVLSGDVQSSRKSASIGVYAGKAMALKRTISLGYYTSLFETAFGVDDSGLLYAAPENQSNPNGPTTLSVYANQGKKVVRTLNQSHSFELITLDPANNIFTYCASDRICEYGQGNKPVRRIALRKLGDSGSLAVDNSGNLAVVGWDGPVAIFAPGSETPYWTIRNGITNSTAAAFDASGNLYIATKTGSQYEIAVYAPNGTTPTRVITDGITAPTSFAFDQSGDLYVLNSGSSGSVSVYAPGGSSPVRTITQGVVGVRNLGAGGGLAIDSSSDLYVANAAVFPNTTGSVTVYAPGSNTPSRTVTDGVENPIAIAVAP